MILIIEWSSQLSIWLLDLRGKTGNGFVEKFPKTRVFPEKRQSPAYVFWSHGGSDRRRQGSVHLRPRPIVQQKAAADPPVFILPGRSESYSEALAVNAVTCTNPACRTTAGPRSEAPWQHVGWSVGSKVKPLRNTCTQCAEVTPPSFALDFFRELFHYVVCSGIFTRYTFLLTTPFYSILDVSWCFSRNSKRNKQCFFCGSIFPPSIYLFNFPIG